MNFRSLTGLSILVAALAVLAAACSADRTDSTATTPLQTTTTAAQTTTTTDGLSEITYRSPGLGTRVFNGVWCDLDRDFEGTITGEDELDGTIAIILEGGGGSIWIRDAFLQIENAPVTSVEDSEQIALDVTADSVPVLVSIVYSEWPACGI